MTPLCDSTAFKTPKASSPLKPQRCDFTSSSRPDVCVCLETVLQENKSERKGSRAQRRRYKKMDGVSIKRPKFRVRFVFASCYLSSRREDERGEKSRRRRIIPSADSFLFISHSWVTTSSVHLPPDPLSCLSLSLSLICPSFPARLPLFLSLSLSRIISCLLTHPNVSNILLSIYRACGMKCVCVEVCVCVCECVSALYSGSRVCLCVYIYVGSLWSVFGILIRVCTVWTLRITLHVFMPSVNYIQVFTKKDNRVKVYAPIC